MLLMLVTTPLEVTDPRHAYRPCDKGFSKIHKVELFQNKHVL